MKTISICMITYNHEKFIREAIESVLAQKTDYEYELVIGEDCSTDNTREICLEYGEKYPNKIKLLLNDKNLGMIPNFFETLISCSAKYVAILEGDDYWTDPLKLQTQVDFLEANEDCVACFHDTQQIFENDKSLGKIYGNDAPANLFAIDTFTTLSPFHTSSFLFRSSALNIPDFFFKVVSGDMALFSIIAKTGYIKKIHGTMSVYRKHDGGITDNSNLIDTFHEKRIELMQYLNEFHEFLYSAKANQVIDYHRSEIKSKLIIDKKDNFINVYLTYRNMDLYLIRVSIQNAINTFLPKAHGILLDIGCGKMPYKKYIIANSSVTHYVGLDIDKAIVYDEIIRPDYTWNGVTMPFKDSEFDCAFGTEVLEHCFEPEIILKETYRVLKPGGVFFFTVPFLWNLHEVPNDAYRYTPFSLKRHLENSGFSDVEIHATGGWHGSLAQMLGLWIKRSPISDRKRKYLSYLIMPILRYLIKKDKLNVIDFMKAEMITGLYGRAAKK